MHSKIMVKEVLGLEISKIMHNRKQLPRVVNRKRKAGGCVSKSLEV